MWNQKVEELKFNKKATEYTQKKHSSPSSTARSNFVPLTCNYANEHQVSDVKD